MLTITRVISRRIHGKGGDVTVPKLTGFSIVSPKNVEVEYGDGSKFSFSSEFLRVHSPAADGKVRSIGGEKVISGRRYVGIMSAEPVGNYGVRTGIYPWDYFYELGSNKFGLMRSYIKILQKHHLSREPLPRRG
ncbi:Myb domain protein [Hirschfeldia incana]|nr:Myb domain protein [Hirschfeldia incana]